MTYKLGSDQFFHNSNAEGGGRATTGIVVSGGILNESEVREVRSIGDWKPVVLREGMLRATGSVNLMLQTEGILALAERDGNGHLTSFDIEGGIDDWSQIHHACKIDTLTLSADAGGELMGTLAWKGRYAEDGGGGGAHAPSTNDVLMWYEGAAAGGNFATQEIIGFTVNISHNCDWVPLIDNSIDPKRSAKYIREGPQVVSANFRFLEHENFDIAAECLAYIASATLTFTNTCDGSTITITLTNLQRGTQEMPITPDFVNMGATYSVQTFTVA